MPVKPLDPEMVRPTQTGPGGGGTRQGTPGGMGGATGGGQSDDDREILLRMIDAIRNRLRQVVHAEPSLLPASLRPLFLVTWEETDRCFDRAASRLATEAGFRRLLPKFRAAGLTGAMLRLKDASLRFHDARFAAALASYSESPLSYPPNRGWRGRLISLARPAFQCMDSILGSLASVLPILEIPKEYKEQVEVGVTAMPRLG